MKTNLDEMLAFVSVVDSGSISAAAEQLEQTASGVSRALSRLEDKLTVTLLRRTTRRLELTEEGEAFLAQARRILASVEEAEEQMALRRQAVARLQRAAGDLGGHRIRQLQIFEPRHYCTESNVFLAPSNVPDHLGGNKPMIAPRRAQAIRGHDGAGAETAFASTA